MNFDQAFERLVDPSHEGAALSLDPDDKGNWTGGAVNAGKLKGSRYGISAARYPGEDIAGLTLERAKTLYLRDYWGPAGCDGVPDAIKFDLFDMCVNSGLGNAVRTLQAAAGVPVDGVLGPHTLAAVQAMPALRLWARFNGARLDLLNNNPHLWALYGRGWSQRIAENLLAQ